MPDKENVAFVKDGKSLSKTGRFTQKEHIKRPADIRKLFKTGKRVSVAGAKLFYALNDRSTNRIGFPLPRGYGNAVERNQSKRYSRETYRFFKAHLNTGYDMLLLVYPGKDSFHSRCEQFKTLCQKAGLLKG
ncbi:MAG: ribonuclease P protein component [Treponema sp.]|nr:ribonuclease P protein component [Treponema sp.]